MRQPGLIVAPGVFELISARIADRMGFECLYATGYGMVASHLGLPDAGLATYSDMVGRVARIAQATQTPLVADADTGYGGLLNVQHTVRGYEAAGAAVTTSGERVAMDTWSATLRVQVGAADGVPHEQQGDGGPSWTGPTAALIELRTGRGRFRIVRLPARSAAAKARP